MNSDNKLMWKLIIVAECDELCRNLLERTEEDESTCQCSRSSVYWRCSPLEVKLEALGLQPSYSVVILILLVLLLLLLRFTFLEL